MKDNNLIDCFANSFENAFETVLSPRKDAMSEYIHRKLSAEFGENYREIIWNFDGTLTSAGLDYLPTLVFNIVFGFEKDFKI